MPLKWGILGCGLIAEDFVLALKCLSSHDHQVVAVAARNIERASTFASKHQIKTSYGSYDKLAADETVDVVYVGVVNSCHFDVTKMVLNNGKNVLCEKPLALNLKQVRELITLAKERKLFLMQAVWSRCFPAYKRLSEILSQGTVGEIKYVTCNMGKSLLVERLIKKSLGGGTILDLGIYCIQFLLLVLGKEKPKISAVATLNEEGVDTGMSGALKFSSGALASINTSSECNLECDAIIYGSKGSIKVFEPFWSPTRIEVNGAVENFPIPSNDIQTNFTNSAGLQFEAEEVRRCITNGLLESPLISSQETELITEIMDEIRSQVGVIFDEDQV